MSRETLSQQIDRLSADIDSYENSCSWVKEPNYYFGKISIGINSDGNAENHGYGGSSDIKIGDLFDDRESAKELATLLNKIQEKQYFKKKAELATILKKYMDDK